VNFFIGEESCFFLDYPHDDVWAASRDGVPETPMTKIDAGTCMVSIIWSISRIQSLLALTKGMKYKCNSQHFCQHVIPDIQLNICSSSRKTTLLIRLHHLRIHTQGASKDYANVNSAH
jgi:hypothetical protein